MNPPAPSRIRQSPKSLFPYLFAGLFLLAFFDSWQRAGIDPKVFFEPRGQRALGKFLTGMFPPDLSPAFLSLMFRPALETIQISILGTIIAVIIGFPLGLLGTNTMAVAGILNEAELQGAPLRRGLRYAVYFIARGLLSLFRSIPEFVWAFMFVRAVGLGPFPGVLAIGLAYGGMLGKVNLDEFTYGSSNESSAFQPSPPDRTSRSSSRSPFSITWLMDTSLVWRIRRRARAA